MAHIAASHSKGLREFRRFEGRGRFEEDRRKHQAFEKRKAVGRESFSGQ